MSFAAGCQYTGFWAGGADPYVTCQNVFSNTVAGSSFTINSVDFGAEVAGRFIVIGIFTGRETAGAHAISAVTVGGVSATQLATTKNGESTCALWGALVPTGTSGSVVVTTTQAVNRCVIGVWSVYNLNSTTAVASNTATADPATLDVNTQNGGVVICFAQSIAVAATMSWTGVTANFTTDVSTTVFGASASGLLTETPRTVSADVSTANEYTAVSVSLR